MQHVYDIELFSKLNPLARAMIDASLAMWTRIINIRMMTLHRDQYGNSLDVFDTNGVIIGDNILKRSCGTYAEWFMIVFREFRKLVLKELRAKRDAVKISDDVVVNRFDDCLNWLVSNNLINKQPSNTKKAFRVVKLLYENELEFRKDCKK